MTDSTQNVTEGDEPVDLEFHPFANFFPLALAKRGHAFGFGTQRFYLLRLVLDVFRPENAHS